MASGKQVTIGHLASAAAYIIFGINVVVCRDIAVDGTVAPIVLFTMRALVAGVLFWLVSLFGPKETVPPRDLLRLAGAGMLVCCCHNSLSSMPAVTPRLSTSR